MRILIHDFSGHPGQIHLSRALARRGHRVTHAFFPDAKTTTGKVERAADDPPNFSIERLTISRPYEKYKYLQRILAEREYGARLGDFVLENDPDVFLTCNTPPDSVYPLLRRLKKARGASIWWVADVYSIGIEAVISRKNRLLGRMLGRHYRAGERAFGMATDALISISNAFLPHLLALGIPKGKCHVIENWGPLDEIVPLPHENAWKTEQGLSGKTVVLYAGTLGLKHDSEVFAVAAEHMAAAGKRDVAIVVVAGGPAADRLRQIKAERNLEQLIILPWQPYNRISEMLSSGDIVVAQLGDEAGEYSVPSKVLSYLCAGRPILAAMTQHNLAARIIEAAEAGFVVASGDHAAFLGTLDRLLGDATLREQLGRNARRYAETHFDIETVTDSFEAVFKQAIRPGSLEKADILAVPANRHA